MRALPSRSAKGFRRSSVVEARRESLLRREREMSLRAAGTSLWTMELSASSTSSSFLVGLGVPLLFSMSPLAVPLVDGS